jgi:hypothetical protein
MVALLVASWFVVVVFSACFHKRGSCRSCCPCLGRNSDRISDCIVQGTSKNKVLCAIQISQIGAPIILPRLARLAPPIPIPIGNRDVQLPLLETLVQPTSPVTSDRKFSSPYLPGTSARKISGPKSYRD